MNIGIILSGGIGSRINIIDTPKQYFEVAGKMVIEYSIEKFVKNPKIDFVVIVCAKEWEPKIASRIQKYDLGGKILFAMQGTSRQESILNGMKKVEKLCNENDLVVIHDSARPFVTNKMIDECIELSSDYFGIMPAIKVKDTIYTVNDNVICTTLNRDFLVAGQSPESFKFIEYLKLFDTMTSDELQSIKGSSEIAVQNGKKIKIIDGDENNFKITTNIDIEKYCSLIDSRNNK